MCHFIEAEQVGDKELWISTNKTLIYQYKKKKIISILHLQTATKPGNKFVAKVNLNLHFAASNHSATFDAFG
jgi:hypothetical protein